MSNLDLLSNDLKNVINCTIIKNGVAEPCPLQRLLPGSNLYFACWCCMLSAIAIALKWKTAKALNFAQAQQQQQEDAEAIDIEREGPDDTNSVSMQVGPITHLHLFLVDIPALIPYT
ncbi:hypothetical protein FRACYDRAFT_247389 [Fragilariopsis cylindrus CCMP1102]|uniref:Uncharacterized protein n=1 Tax=Fragilariopsis cylindrus CCMP1102 TaxID=635003 RepID=A0A1E7EWX2_9STRA|nr:hypothetical protein FRACYDRAFT_247389 [Fragilariopsis cylindrus CCMP1102]|eukprot:OEU10356.1 hypothetical protein FRACYDRAFT_247389 [Fragilariopsis cylindrus CCMP1102]